MRNFIVITALVLSLTFTASLAEVPVLQEQDTNSDHIDPLNDNDQDLTDNSQDKRTICSALNQCSRGHTASGQIRHVVVKPVIKPQLVGYASIARPVGIRPVVIGGYRYPKPKIHFRLKAPSFNKPAVGGWTPVISSTKPAVQVVKPTGHVDVVHTKPVTHVDHVPITPAAVPASVHVDHAHVQPGHVHVKPVQPVAIQGAHIDQVHQVSVPHGGHYDIFTHVDHVHQAAVPVAQPVVPVAPPPTVVKPFIPSPVLFEVTRPNLGVLPFGARFPSPILREVPHVHLKPIVPVAPAVSVQPVSPAHHYHYHPAAPVPPPPVQGIIQTPVGFPHIVPQPGVSIEYHGTRNYLPFAGGTPVLSQIPGNAAHPSLTSFGVSTAYPHQQLPFEHTHHGFAPTQQLPHNHQAHGFLQQQLPYNHQAHSFLQQQLPHNHQAHGFFPQQLPHDHQAQFSPEHQLPQESSSHFLQNQVEAAQQYQEIPQGQLPLEGEQNFDQFLQNVQSFNQNNVIQPGQTDVQIPYHLPQHPGWEATSGFQQQQQIGLQEESRGFSDQVFRPSPQLEPPYNK